MSSLKQCPLNPLAMTAWWTAAARARESERPDCLFYDPWAMVLAGPEGLAEFDSSVAGQGNATLDIQSISTRFFDEFLLSATMAQTIEQVVIVAAGLDTRGFRLSWPDRTVLFELDQPLVLAYKEDKLASIEAHASCSRHVVGVDLNGQWTDFLCAEGFDRHRCSAWLLEGVLYFLPERVVTSILDAITFLSPPGSRLGFDVVNNAMLSAPETRYWIERMENIGVPWLFACDEPEVPLVNRGWKETVRQPGEGDAYFGRCPYPIAPRSIPGIPRSFLVAAERVK
jgi:methyltransferase (TIGR00027 family)